MQRVITSFHHPACRYIVDFETPGYYFSSARSSDTWVHLQDIPRYLLNSRHAKRKRIRKFMVGIEREWGQQEPAGPDNAAIFPTEVVGASAR